MIHTQKLPTFALYAAYADEFGVSVFGSTRDEALNNLAGELRHRKSSHGQVAASRSAVSAVGDEGNNSPPVQTVNHLTGYEREGGEGKRV
jgi:hypothetical protein